MSEEREIKIAAPSSFVLPDLDGVAAGVKAVDRGHHRLDATYWDSETLALQRAGFGLRYRTTDGRAGRWTLKAQSRRDGPAVVREEIDMDGEPDHPPAHALERTRSAVGDVDLRPVATLRTTRHIVDLMEQNGRRLAEVADDIVSILDGDRELGAFREVEVELMGEPDSALVDTVLNKLRAAGAADIDPTPKYVRALRALGYDVPVAELS
jgi:inorganic triphosphatase YgiF